MQNGAHTPPHTVAHVAILIACFIAVFAVGFSVIVLLKSAAPVTPSQEKVALSATETIAQYSKPDVIKGLSEETYAMQTDKGADGMVVYRSSTASYIINTPTKHNVLFAATKASVNDTPAIQEQTTAFMKQHGFEKAGNVGTARGENPSYATYQNDKTVCMLASARPVEGSTLLPYHKLSCTDKTAIQDEYDATDKLLTLYKNGGGKAPFTEAARQTKTEGNKSLAVVSLINDEQSVSELFASIDNQWAYIGSLTDSAGTSNGKYAMSEQVRQALADPKYGDFLVKNIQP